MYCSSCGCSNEDGAKFCAECGALIEVAKVKDRTARARKHKGNAEVNVKDNVKKDANKAAKKDAKKQRAKSERKREKPEYGEYSVGKAAYALIFILVVLVAASYGASFWLLGGREILKQILFI